MRWRLYRKILSQVRSPDTMYRSTMQKDELERTDMIQTDPNRCIDIPKGPTTDVRCGQGRTTLRRPNKPNTHTRRNRHNPHRHNATHTHTHTHIGSRVAERVASGSHAQNTTRMASEIIVSPCHLSACAVLTMYGLLLFRAGHPRPRGPEQARQA